MSNQSKTREDAIAVTHTQADTEELLAITAAIYADETDASGNEPADGARETILMDPRDAVTSVVGLAGGEMARRGITDALGREKVIAVARRVASRKTAGMSEAEVLAFIGQNDGFRRTLAGHLHEQLDAADLKRIFELRKRLGLKGSWIKLYPEANRAGIDACRKGARKAGQACFSQHKLSENPAYLKEAASKAGKSVRGKTELVVGRGVKVSERTSHGLKSVREASRWVGEIRGLVEKAADPAKANAVGAEAAKKLTAKAGVGAAVLGAGASVAFDIRAAKRGEKTAGEVAENAAWAGSEAAASTLATAGATAAAAPAIAMGTTALAGSSIAGTTAMAAGLTTLGPIGLGIGVGIGVSYGVRRIRKATRGQ